MTLPLLVALLVLTVLVAAVAWSVAAPSVGRLALVVLVAAAWLPVNKPVEGPTLLTLGHDRGVTLSDLLSVAAVVLATLPLLLARRSSSSADVRRPTRTGS
ncbi:MAG TPA: hypothetical protein VFL94_15845 [Actinomycetales bacterium]|nr:hypothetical protein [Actinomycetales bacterium]